MRSMMNDDFFDCAGRAGGLVAAAGGGLCVVAAQRALWRHLLARLAGGGRHQDRRVGHRAAGPPARLRLHAVHLSDRFHPGQPALAPPNVVGRKQRKDGWNQRGGKKLPIFFHSNIHVFLYEIRNQETCILFKLVFFLWGGCFKKIFF